METIDKKIVWEGKFLRTLNITYRDKSGNLRNWEAVERVNCNGIVVIVPVTPDNETIFIRQFRPVLDNFVIEFPAGLNDRGESLIDAANRELIEETGYAPGELIYLAEGPVSSGISTEILTVFLALDAVPAPSELKRLYQPEESENIEIVITPLSDAGETLETFKKKGDYIDLKVYGLLELAKRKAAGR